MRERLIRQKLVDFVALHIGKPFIWGERDCSTLALQWLDIIAGTHAAADIVCQYDSARTAALFQHAYGRTVAEILRDGGAVDVDKSEPGDWLIVHRDGEPWQRVQIVFPGCTVFSADEATGAKLWPIAYVDAGATILRCNGCRQR